MTKLLIKLFIKDADNTANAAVRSRYGVLSGAVGIACNLLLTIAKFLIGSLTNSIAITADAVNNLSDAGSSAVTLFSFRPPIVRRMTNTHLATAELNISPRWELPF